MVPQDNYIDRLFSMNYIPIRKFLRKSIRCCIRADLTKTKDGI